MDSEEPTSQGGNEKPAGKKGPPAFVLLLGAIVATGGSAAAGAVLGPSLAGKSHAPPAAASAAAEKTGAGAEESPPSEAAALDPIIVDVREATGEMHHLKVSIAIELGHGVSEEDFKKLVPRMRDAAISYLRGLPFDQITTPARFDPIRTELGERIAHAAGKDRVHRVLFTDFVAQ